MMLIEVNLTRYLLGEDFMGCRIGPEPTTDKFHVIMAAEEVVPKQHDDQHDLPLDDQDEDERPRSVVPGNALVVDPKLPFRPKKYDAESSLREKNTKYYASLKKELSKTGQFELIYFALNNCSIDHIRRCILDLN